MTATDRFGIMLFAAACLHAVILSMTFSFPEEGKSAKVLPPLKIILVPQKSKNPVEDADFLAQASNEGSGDAEEKLRPQDKVSSPTVVPQVGTEQETREAASPQETKPIVENVITQDEAEVKIKQVEETKPTPVVEELTADQLITRAEEMLDLSNEISLIQEKRAKKPRITQVTSARAKEYKYASYMESWRQKVERFGRLNYPIKLSEKKVYGETLLAISINPDGTIYEIQVLDSSGNKLVDQAAIAIIRRASPYARLPAEILKETDVLEIVRTLVFEQGNTLSSK